MQATEFEKKCLLHIRYGKQKIASVEELGTAKNLLLIIETKMAESHSTSKLYKAMNCAPTQNQSLLHYKINV